VSHAIQHGYDHALLAHGRTNGIHGPTKIVGLAGEQNDIVGPLKLALLNNLDLCAEFAAVLRLDDQSIAFQLGRALWPDEKCNVGPTLDKPCTKISPEGSRAQYQVSHLVHRCQFLAAASKHAPLPSG
jgi:hypothetical protein